MGAVRQSAADTNPYDMFPPQTPDPRPVFSGADPYQYNPTAYEAQFLGGASLGYAIGISETPERYPGLDMGVPWDIASPQIGALQPALPGLPGVTGR